MNDDTDLNSSAPADKPKRVKNTDDGLVAMRKGGESLRVHPTCVADHKSLGWVED